MPSRRTPHDPAPPRRRARRLVDARWEFAERAGGVGVWDWSAHTGETWWSDGMWALYGDGTPQPDADPQAVWARCLHPEDRDRVDAHVMRALACADGEFEDEFRIVRPDGTIRWLRCIARIERDATGRAVRMSGANVDVTERRQAQQSLAESRRLFERIALATPDLVYVYDLRTHRNVYVNGAIQRVLGYRPAEIAALGPQFLGTLLHPEDLPVAAAAIGAFDTLDEGAVQSHEVRMRAADGRWRWLACREMVFQRDADGRASAIIGVAQDVTDRRLAQAALADSEARFRELAESMPQIVYETRADGTVLFVNRRWYRLTGLEPAERLSMLKVVHPDDRAALVDGWAAARAAEREFMAEFRLRTAPDGEYRWYLTRALPIRGADGAVHRWYGTSTDTHALKLAQQALQAADRRKDEFLATLAHELRNPLAPLRTGIAIMGRDTPAGSASHAVLAMMSRQLEQLRRLVDDLLDVARISRGTIVLRRQRIDAAEVVRRAVESVAPQLESGRHLLSLQVPAAPVAVDADPHRLAQVVGNLLANAVRYTPDGGRIGLRLVCDDRHLQLTVSDTGTGIDPAVREHLFEPFVQGAPAPERAHAGLGIGLALVRQLVELHGGHVHAHSPGPGQGSEFTVRLPLAGAERDGEAPGA